jgi:hypothetical protein
MSALMGSGLGVIASEFRVVKMQHSNNCNEPNTFMNGLRCAHCGPYYSRNRGIHATFLIKQSSLRGQPVTCSVDYGAVVV